MLLSKRPDWTRATKGAPVDVVVRVNGRDKDSRKLDIKLSRCTVSIGTATNKPEDEFEVGFAYGPEATNQDITARSLRPLIKKFVEGYNAAVLCSGATGSGKTHTLEGTRAKQDARTPDAGDGTVHLAIDEVFKALHQRAVAVGEQVAQRRRMPSAKVFEFFLETSYVEVYNEGVRDLHQRGDAANAKLQVYEDELEGYQVAGLTYQQAKSEAEMRRYFNEGRGARDAGRSDLGSTHERSAAIFTIHLAQYSPSAVPGEEDRIMVSRLQFVDLPGCEHLAGDAELIRLREGRLVHGLLSLDACVRELSEAAAAGGAPLAGAVNVQASVLTRLLADALGGNALCLWLGCIRAGDYNNNRTCLRQLAMARTTRTYPIANHGRARGLLLGLRRRLLALVADRNTLSEQIMVEAPAEGDPNAWAISLARVRDLEERLNRQREEMARVVEEKQALQGRLMKHREAAAGNDAEQAETLGALRQSEEARIKLARAFIDAQLEWNDTERRWEQDKLELEKRLVDLEASHFERYVRAEDHAALEKERDNLNAQLRGVQELLDRRGKHIEELKEEVDSLKGKLRKAEADLNMLGGAAGPGDGPQGAAAAAAAASTLDDMEPEPQEDPNSLAAKRRQLFAQLRSKDRRIAELLSELAELSGEVDRARNARQLTQTGVDEMREAYRRRLEVAMRDVADLARAVAIMQEDPSTGLAVKPQDLFDAFQKLTDENLRVTESREREIRGDLDALQARHVDLKTKFKSICLAYRNMRYLIADRWPAGSAPPDVPTEDHVLGAACETIMRGEDDADRRLIARLRDQAASMGTQLSALRIADAAAAKGVAMKPGNLTITARSTTFESNRYIELPDMVSLENQKLREELDRLRNQVAGTPIERLQRENQQLQTQLQALALDGHSLNLAQQVAAAHQEIERLRHQMAGGGPGGAAGVADAHSVTQQIRDFQAGATAELERKLQAAEVGRLMAEEQLASLQTYMAQATVQYQREIVRLRGVIGQLDPGGRLLRADPLRGK